MAWKCDHQFDCPDGEEEISCNHTCPIGTFQCKQDMECISLKWVCDGEKDCKDGSDEDEHGHCGKLDSAHGYKMDSFLNF